MTRKDEQLIHRDTYYDERIPHVPERFNEVTELLDNHIKLGEGDHIAIHYVNPRDWSVEHISYSKLYERVNMTGNALRDKLSVERGDRVGLLMLDSPYLHYFFLAAMKIGAVPVPMNTFASKELVKKMVAKGEMAVLVVDSDILEKVEALKTGVTSLRSIVLTEGVSPLRADAGNHRSLIKYSDLIASSPTELDAADVGKDDVSFWFYTSGSTGEPKGVVHVHHDIHYAAYATYKEFVGLNRTDVIFSAAKLFFSAGLGPGLYGPLTFGASSVLYPGRINAEVCYEIISRFRPTIFLAVPTVFAKMLTEVKNAESHYDISSLRLCLTGGEPLPPTVYSEWKRKMKVELVEGVGAAEMTHFYLGNWPGKVRLGSGGQLLPGYEVKLVDSDGNQVATGKIGEFLIRGDSSLLCYWNDEEKTKKTILDGEWIRTGDLFWVDQDGYYFFCGRYDYAFKANGLWVSPVQIESTILQYPRVQECCVVPKLTKEGVTVPVAFLVLRQGNRPSENLVSNIKEYMNLRLQKYEIPQEYRFVDSLPKTMVEKIDRKALIQML